MSIIKFEVGNSYFNTRKNETIKIDSRTEKTVWFCGEFFRSRIKIINNVETIAPAIGIIRSTYWASKKK